MEIINRSFLKESKGAAIIEYVLLLSIISLTVITVFVPVVNVVENMICTINCSLLEAQYKNYLSASNLNHSDAFFAQFLQGYKGNVCPNHKDLIFIDGNVRCSGHSKGNESDNGDDGDGVPFL